MNKVTLSALVVVALVTGWLLGSMSAGQGTSDPDGALAELKDENTRLRRALGERGPRLQPRVGMGGTAPDGAPGHAAGTTGARPIPERVESYDITQFDDADRAFQMLMAYARTMLAKGEAGHLALLDTINATLFSKPGEKIVERLIGGEEQTARFMYPLIRFAMNHDDLVVDMAETIYRTMAEDPQRLKDIDNDSLELFTEGIALMLPGMVGPKRLERIRGYARTILATAQANQPRSVQQQRGDVQRALGSWAPPVSGEEALVRLQQGTASPEEAMALVRRLRPEDVARLDIDKLLGPLIASDGWSAIAMISRLRPDAATLALLDSRIIRGVSAGKTPQSLVSYWLQSTNRRSWAPSRTFIEAGLQQATTETRGVFLMAALGMKPAPDDDWVQWAERTYQYSDRMRVYLKKRRDKIEAGG